MSENEVSSALVTLESQAFQYIITADEGSIDAAINEVVTIDRKAMVTYMFAPGVLLVNGSMSFADLVAAWAKKPPIYLRHVNPVQSVLYLDEGAEWRPLLEVAAVGEILAYFEPALPFSVQSRIYPHAEMKPFEVNQVVAQAGVEQFGLTLDVRQPEQVVSVVVRSDEGEPAIFYLGGSLASHNLSDWAGGMRRFAREEGQISRAEFKLLEAIEVFGLEIPARGTALDLGAAPGGWTRVLRSLEQYVTAVDPGDLDARLTKDRGVRHKRMTAESYLASDPDPFDIIVNDMRMDARDSARLMVNYAKLLYPHGWALMTLKIPEQKRDPIVEHAFSILRGAYNVAGARQLFHNRSEITVWLTPKRKRYQGEAADTLDENHEDEGDLFEDDYLNDQDDE
jgi:23S rRNA (cytidine2498-2'-O)-methyltransferase